MKHTHRMAVALALSAATVSLAAGCGGDSNDSASADESSISKSEFIVQANAICKRGNASIDKAFVALGPRRPTPEEFNEIVIPRSQGEIDALRQLPTPEGDEETLSSLFDDAQEALDRMKSDPEISFQGTDPFADVNARAIKYGLPACGQ